MFLLESKGASNGRYASLGQPARFWRYLTANAYFCLFFLHIFGAGKAPNFFLSIFSVLQAPVTTDDLTRHMKWNKYMN